MSLICSTSPTCVLQIANLGTYVGAGFASDDPAVQQKKWSDMQRAIDLAAYFGAGLVDPRAARR